MKMQIILITLFAIKASQAILQAANCLKFILGHPYIPSNIAMQKIISFYIFLVPLDQSLIKYFPKLLC